MNNQYYNNYLYPSNIPMSYPTQNPNLNQHIQPAASQQQPNNTNQPYQVNPNWEAQYPESIFSKGPSNCKTAAFTFDDAPDDLFAPVLLDILSGYNVKATFFLNGTCANEHPEIVERIAKEGHILGNHTYNHPDLTTIPADQIRAEIQTTEDLIYQITGLRTALFRPPYGALNQESIQVILSMGYKIILWNVDSLDWTGIPGPTIAARVVSAIVPGSIILMHNACGGSTQAGTGTSQSLPFIIEILRAQGYEFETIPALLKIPAYKTA